MSRFAQLTFTNTVRSIQREHGSGRGVRFEVPGKPEPLTAEEAAFIQSRDGFYLASVGETGWPYIQYRGGPPGFVHVLDESTIAFADVRGNRQYITTGNVRDDDRVALFFMDYARQTRLKMLGHASELPIGADPKLATLLDSHRTDGKVERHLVIRVEGCHWNCPQHITPRFTERELDSALAPIRDRITALEQENAELRAKLGSG
ncbi:pyridoxamine 5-phosphate oxidase [Amycolatopsis coloradensis]|uniref:Pyridoxamine 5-phosphate oxidase n=1 Tax=Amycolatopsis coloradensis TaxID=76021 RepID=A0A1R0KE74_9PSEU|nr:pyridoxamine 5'-phosphate oxidase family protein [Amycolatopsis coloradensis]OLZ43387.1 pyridoxamine 5-phosphate oxidase [Amycolatopsis coloradensis]